MGHEAAGDELLVFYRESERSHPGAGFQYRGAFRYLSHSGHSPTSFVLQRASAREEAEAPDSPFDPNSVEDGRRKIWAQVKQRQGQPKFRRELIRAYGGRCAITGCAFEALLEAAHIHPYRGVETNRVNNGLLLRADIHTLFDLGLIRIPPDLLVEVSDQLVKSDYANLKGSKLRLPILAADHPSELALAWHRDAYRKM
jgi:predicted restriction endonuclease